MGSNEILPPPIESDSKKDNNLTISTKLSTDQLICKTPQESPNSSVKCLNKEELQEKKCGRKCGSLLYLGTLQILLGLLMAACGVLVIVHNASLGQIGGGLWGGCLAVATGTAGVLAAARDWCPLRNTPQRMAHTAFLALSLISLAVAQLVVVLAATGLARDVNKDHGGKNEEQATTPSPEESSLPGHYPALLSSIALLVVSSLECITAAISSYKAARELCACFRPLDEHQKGQLYFNTRNAFVDSWLGKHNPSPPVYVVTTTSRRSKISTGVPVYAIPPPQLLAPQVVRYPLIPAPLGPVPSPIIRTHRPKEMISKRHRRYPPDQQLCRPHKKSKKSKLKEKQVTTEEVAKTYTGLDRTIAEEFIEICDSRNNSLCSDSSCRSSCNGCQGGRCHPPCQSGCTTSCTSVCNTSSDLGSREYVEKL